MSTFVYLPQRALVRLQPNVVMCFRNNVVRCKAINPNLKAIAADSTLNPFKLNAVCFSTTRHAKEGAKNENPEKAFSKYEKAAISEEVHFQVRHKEAEEKTKALIAIKEDQNTQGIESRQWLYLRVRKLILLATALSYNYMFLFTP